MNAAPLLLLPLATVALLSSQPSKVPANDPVDAPDVTAVLDRPEVRALTERLKEAASQLNEPDRPLAPGRLSHSVRRQEHEVGLHTSHLETAALPKYEGVFSAARGLSSEDEWQQMFPRYAMKLSAAR